MEQARVTEGHEISDAGGAGAPAPGHPYRGFLVRAILGLALLTFLISHSGGKAILSLLARERVAYFAAAVALYVAGQVMSAYRWQLLAARVSIHGPFREFLAYYFIGIFTNLFVPGLVGGFSGRDDSASVWLLSSVGASLTVIRKSPVAEQKPLLTVTVTVYLPGSA